MAEKLYYQESGQGKPLVLLHGYPLDHTIWLELVPYLEKSCRVILPDLRGHGRSPVPTGPYSMKTMAEDVINLLDALEIDKTVIAGHSMGGYVAIAAARYFPTRLSAMALVASHAYADSPEKRESRMSSIERIKKEGLHPVLVDVPAKLSNNERVKELGRRIISSAHRDGVIGILAGMAERPDSIEFLSGFALPIMIIAGQEDRFIPVETSRNMANEIKNAKLIEIPNAGHMPMLEKPDRTAEALLSFINSL